MGPGFVATLTKQLQQEWQHRSEDLDAPVLEIPGQRKGPARGARRASGE